jgi:hypothetical protein
MTTLSEMYAQAMRRADSETRASDLPEPVKRYLEGLFGRMSAGTDPIRGNAPGYQRTVEEATGMPRVGEGVRAYAERMQSPEARQTLLNMALTFGGLQAKTANKALLDRAELLEKSGVDPRDIWKETGWFRAPWDKKWRFEIDDLKAKGVSGKTLLKKDLKELFDEDGIPYEYKTKLPDAIKHKDLYEAYPNMQKDRAYAMRSAYGADADYSRGAFRFDPALAADDLRNVGLHEVQHRIQDLEGFARGGYADPNYRGVIDVFDPNYRNMAGEAEARAVQRRLNYSTEKRRATFPLDDFDVPIDELITKFR